jgi:hypothetical protein
MANNEEFLNFPSVSGLFMDDREFELLLSELGRESDFGDFGNDLTEFSRQLNGGNNEIGYLNNGFVNSGNSENRNFNEISNENGNNQFQNQASVFDVQNGFSAVYDNRFIDILDPNLTIHQRHALKMNRRAYLNSLVSFYFLISVMSLKTCHLNRFLTTEFVFFFQTTRQVTK